VAAARALREQALAAGKESLIGANEFPDIDVATVPVLDVERVTVPAIPTAVAIESLKPMRLAVPFEESDAQGRP
jgi:methylmalonyl-CoA mutase N-terminal domain/subunit